MRKTIIYIVIFLVLLVTNNHKVWAQNTSSSPYSSAGFGEMKSSAFVGQRGIGGSQIAFNDVGSFTSKNPASYSALAFTSFDAGMYFGRNNVDNGTSIVRNPFGNFGYFALAMPIPSKSNRGFAEKIKLAGSLGLHEHTQVGYNFKTSPKQELGKTYYEEYSAVGGLNKGYVGLAATPFKNFSVGVNYQVLFGSIKELQSKIYPDTIVIFSYTDEKFNYYTGGNIESGVQYSIQTKTIKHTFGATYALPISLKIDGYRFVNTQAYSRSRELFDTVLFTDNISSVSFPSTWGVGYALKTEKMNLAFDYEVITFSTLKNSSLFDAERISMGYAITPSINYAEKGNYLQKIQYRVGANYQKLQNNIKETQLTEFGITFGVGLPVVKLTRSKTPQVSRINISAEYVSRGNTIAPLVKEDVFTLAIGFNFNDKWFLKRKYQ